MRISCVASVILVLTFLSVPNVGASSVFPQENAVLKYVSQMTVTYAPVGNMTTAIRETFGFHRFGTEWNVSHVADVEVICPRSMNLTLQSFAKTGSQIANVTDRFHLEASLTMKDDRRIIAATASPDSPVGFFARCVGTGDRGPGVVWFFPEAEAAPTGYYAYFYVTNSTKIGSTVYVESSTVGPLFTKKVTFFGTTRDVLYGKGGNYWYYFDSATGVLLWMESTSHLTSTTLVESSVSIPELSFSGGLMLAFLIGVVVVIVNKIPRRRAPLLSYR